MQNTRHVWFSSYSWIDSGFMLEFAWNQTLLRRPQTGCFGLHSNAIAFSPAQTNHTKEKTRQGSIQMD